MKEAYNPALRLLNILNLLKAYQPETHAINTVWVKLFDLDLDDKQTILDVPIRLLKLVSTVEKQINSTVPKPDIYLDQVTIFANNIYSIAHKRPVKDLQNQINQNMLNQLQICSDIINSNGYTEKIIDPKTLSDLLQEVQELSGKIFDMDMDVELKQYLLSCLNNMELAIKFYKIHGCESFIEALKSKAGNLYFYQDMFAKMKEPDEKTKEITLGVFNLIGKFNDVIQTAQYIAVAFPNVKDLVKQLPQYFQS